MTALLGFITICILLIAIISKKMSPLAALITIPTLAALIHGAGLATSTYIVNEIEPIPIILIFSNYVFLES